MLKLSDNWVVQNLQNALDTWNEKLAEIESEYELISSEDIDEYLKRKDGI